MNFFQKLSTSKLLSLFILASSLLVSPSAQASWVEELTSYKTVANLATGKGVVVAVLDSGVNRSLFTNGNILPGLDLVDSGTVINDTNSHGSEVIATLLSVTPEATVLPIRVLGEGGTDMEKVANGIIYATDNGAKVINLSFGAPGACSEAGQSAVNYANAHGVIVVAAVGNSNTNLVSCPAGYEGVLGVGASNRFYQKSLASNYGSSLDLLAPGDNLAIPYNNSIFYLNGSSFSAPLVSATLAALFELYPSLTSSNMLDILTSSVTDIYTTGRDDLSGYGILDPLQALLIAGGASPLQIIPTLSASPISTAGESSTLTLKIGGVARVKLYSKLTGSDISPWEIVFSGEVNEEKLITTTPLNDTSYYLCISDNQSIISSCSAITNLVVPNALDNSLKISLMVKNGVVNNDNPIQVSAAVGNPRVGKAGLLVNLTINSTLGQRLDLSATTDDSGVALFNLNTIFKGELSAYARASFDGKSATANQLFLTYELGALPNFSRQGDILSFNLLNPSLTTPPLPLAFQAYDDGWKDLIPTTNNETLTITLPSSSTALRYQAVYLEGDYRFLPTQGYINLPLNYNPVNPSPLVESPTAQVELPAPVVVSPTPEVTPSPESNSTPLVLAPLAAATPIVVTPAPIVVTPAPIVETPAPIFTAPSASSVNPSVIDSSNSGLSLAVTAPLNTESATLTLINEAKLSNSVETSTIIMTQTGNPANYTYTIQSMKTPANQINKGTGSLSSTKIDTKSLSKALSLTKITINKLLKIGVKKFTITGNSNYLNGVKRIVTASPGVSFTYKVSTIALIKSS